MSFFSSQPIDLTYLKQKYFNTTFITIFVITFIFLFLFCSIINFIGRFPILILVSIGITFIIYKKYFESAKKLFQISESDENTSPNDDIEAS